MTTPHIPRRVLVMGGVAAATLFGFGAGALMNSVGAGAQTTSTTTPKTAAAGDMKGGCGDRTPLDDATAKKVEAAALKAVPGATVKKTHADRDGGYVAMLLKSDGTTRVLVHEDKDFKVTSVEDPAPLRGPGGPGRGGHGPRPDKATTPTTAAAS